MHRQHEGIFAHFEMCVKESVVMHIDHLHCFRLYMCVMICSFMSDVALDRCVDIANASL